MTRITRLDNNLWGYVPEASESEDDSLAQIQITTPSWQAPKLSYMFAQIVEKALINQKITTRAQLEDGFTLTIENNEEPLLGKWNISLVQHTSFLDQFYDYFPMLRTFRDRHVAVITASREDPLQQIARLFSKSVHSRDFLFSQKVDPLTAVLPVPGSFEEEFSIPLFQDPFTNLAALYFQSNDPYYISEEKVEGAYRYVLSPTGDLQLEEITTDTPTEEQKEQNRAVTQFYKTFIRSNFGEEKLEYISHAYGFSFNDLIATGAPLVPDHVFKSNIGVNNIELGDVQRLYNKLLNYALNPDQLSIKELRKLTQLITHQRARPATADELSQFANTFIRESPQLVQDLPPDMFNVIVDLVMPTDKERDLAFTGRKITHLSIAGDMTQGNSNIFNPSRDLFELLHLFPQYRKANWDNYLELVTHVAVKKSLFRKTPPQIWEDDDNQWHVGILLPGPDSQDGQKRWYYNEAMTDDGEGNLNYVLLPACSSYRENEKRLPMIKAYRSTASNRNAVDGLESMLADINPYGSPNSIIPDNGYQYEKKYFEERTIPAWVGYLLLGDQKSDPTLYEKALEEYLYCINAPGETPPEKLHTANTLQATQEHMNTRDFLYQEALLHKELPEYKIAQDIYWAGHSLGGGLSQFGIYYHGTRRNRIPLQGCTFYCYSSRAPAIDTATDEAFVTFGRKHKQLITELNGQRWKVKHDFEYGDFVPEGGHSHLGTTGYVEELDSDWLDEEITIFKPSETAVDVDITTHCTHGRRTGKALEGRDFTVKKMSVDELSAFDHSWWMTADLIETFGYRILRSSKIAEYVREIFAQITYPFWHIIVQIYNYIWPPFGQRDNKGNWNLNYTPPTF